MAAPPSGHGVAPAAHAAEEPSASIAYDPFIAPHRDDPYPVWAMAREQQPVFFSERLGAWVVTRHADVCAVLRDPVRFANAGATNPLRAPPPAVGAILATGFAFDEMPPVLATDPPLHTRLRKFANAAFTPQRVAALEPRVRQVADELLDSFTADGNADFVARFAFPFPLTVVGDLLGVPRTDHAQLHHWSDDKTAVQWGSLLEDDFANAARGFVAFQRYCERLIEDRRNSPRDDIVSAMVAIRLDDEQPLSTGELVGQMMGLVSAGHETTMNLLAHAVLCLLQARERWDALVADPGGMAPVVVEETLRFDSPVMGMWRTATDDVEIGGSRIPRGARIQVLYGSANRDAAVFRDPDRFDLGREINAAQHLAFGRGIHFCLGAPLARLEGRVALETLARRLPGLRLDPAAGPVVWRPNAAFRGPERLMVEWDPARRRQD